MADTTIKVTTETRDRLAGLAAERGTTVKELVEEMAGARPTEADRPTEAERKARADAAFEYIKTHIRPDFSEADRIAGRKLMDDLAAGRITELVDDEQWTDAA